MEGYASRLRMRAFLDTTSLTRRSCKFVTTSSMKLVAVDPNTGGRDRGQRQGAEAGGKGRGQRLSDL
jgi:hypothetical protein